MIPWWRKALPLGILNRNVDIFLSLLSSWFHLKLFVRNSQRKEIIQKGFGILNARDLILNEFITGYLTLLPGSRFLMSCKYCGIDVTLEEKDRLRLRICPLTLSFQSSDNNMQLRHNCKQPSTNTVIQALKSTLLRACSQPITRTCERTHVLYFLRTLLVRPHLTQGVITTKAFKVLILILFLQ